MGAYIKGHTTQEYSFSVTAHFWLLMQQKYITKILFSESGDAFEYLQAKGNYNYPEVKL